MKVFSVFEKGGLRSAKHLFDILAETEEKAFDNLMSAFGGLGNDLITIFNREEGEILFELHSKDVYWKMQESLLLSSLNEGDCFTTFDGIYRKLQNKDLSDLDNIKIYCPPVGIDRDMQKSLHMFPTVTRVLRGDRRNNLFSGI